MKRPPYLKPGDTVGIVAPSSFLKEEEISHGLEVINSWGVKIKTGKYLYKKINSFAGNDCQRMADLQDMLDDSEVKAIICARGGYGTLRIIKGLDFSRFRKNPKWIAGCSDITVLHSALSTFGIESLHSAMPRGITTSPEDKISMESLKDALFGNTLEYDVNPHPMNREGSVKGVISGGNLSVLYSLRGTQYDIDTAGKILFIEDVGEYLYHIDRMMTNLSLGHKLSNLKALIIGGMNLMRISGSGYRKKAYTIIREAVSEYCYPMVFGMPAGHIHPNKTLIMGRKVEIKADSHNVKIIFMK